MKTKTQVSVIVLKSSEDQNPSFGHILRQDEELLLHHPEEPSIVLKHALSDLVAYSPALMDWVLSRTHCKEEGNWSIAHTLLICDKTHAAMDSERGLQLGLQIIARLHVQIAPLNPP